MANIQAISVERYSKLFWSRYTDYSFAGRDAVSPISVYELPKAVLSLPIGFVKSNDDYMLVALQGIQAGTNLFVDENGAWLGAYVPQSYACYPFLLLPNEEGERVLCIDEDSNMVSDVEGTNMLPFFDVDNAPTDKLGEIMEFLGNRTSGIEHTVKLCALLAKHDLLRRWEIKIQAEEGETTISDLFCIDEKKLEELSASALEELHKENALLLIYGQLFSMRNLDILGRLGQSKISAYESNAAKSSELNFDLVEDGNSLNFDNL